MLFSMGKLSLALVKSMTYESTSVIYIFSIATNLFTALIWSSYFSINQGHSIHEDYSKLLFVGSSVNNNGESLINV
jgi:hypothetical protein